MSKTDSTRPWRLVHGRGECPAPGYPCPCLSSTKPVQVYRRKHTRADRTQLRSDLAHGVEPATQQHRHSAKWEAW